MAKNDSLFFFYLLYLILPRLYYLLLVDDSRWIDVCPNNGNLLVSGGGDLIVRIFDKRKSGVAQNFESIHSRKIL